MKTVLVQASEKFPFGWANLKAYRKSNAFRKEIYLKDGEYDSSDLVEAFHFLFKDIKESLIIFNRQWWQYCVDTWDIETGSFDYGESTKSEITNAYFKMLKRSHIGIEFTGGCLCKDWDEFLKISLDCLLSHQAPYSPVFCCEPSQFFFYFHHTGSLGLYYKSMDATLRSVIERANWRFRVEN